MYDWYMIQVPHIIVGKVKRRKSRVILAPTMEHYYGTVAHTTVNGKGKVARIKRR